MELQGKVAFITGGGGGIGGGIALAFAEKGMRLVLADIDLAHAETQAREFGASAIAIALDVTSPDSWAAARKAALTRFGQVDVLCNNAGIAAPLMPLDQLAPDAFSRVLAVNVTGVYNGVAAFAAHMRARGSGHIVNTSSVNGLLPFANFAAYSASKFAVLGLSDALRAEMAGHGVGVSTLFPGLTRSRMSLAADSPAAASGAAMMEPIWLGRAVVAAIEANQAYIVTHPGYRPMFEARCANLLAAFGEPAQPGYQSGASATRRTE